MTGKAWHLSGCSSKPTNHGRRRTGTGLPPPRRVKSYESFGEQVLSCFLISGQSSPEFAGRIREGLSLKKEIQCQTHVDVPHKQQRPRSALQRPQAVDVELSLHLAVVHDSVQRRPHSATGQRRPHSALQSDWSIERRPRSALSVQRPQSAVGAQRLPWPQSPALKHWTTSLSDTTLASSTAPLPVHHGGSTQNTSLSHCGSSSSFSRKQSFAEASLVSHVGISTELNDSLVLVEEELCTEQASSSSIFSKTEVRSGMD